MELIKEYNPNVDWDEEQIVEVTLMQWEYVGRLYFTVSGNCKGLDLLKNADFSTDTFEEAPKDFELEYFEDEDFFHYALHDENGDTLDGEADEQEMNNMIVSIRLVNELPKFESEE